MYSYTNEYNHIHLSIRKDKQPWNATQNTLYYTDFRLKSPWYNNKTLSKGETTPDAASEGMYPNVSIRPARLYVYSNMTNMKLHRNT